MENSTFAERIATIISSAGITKSKFAERIKVSQAFVSQICSGARIPGDRTISDICREFGIREQWLRTGEGNMFIPVSRDAEIAAFMGDVMHGESGDFRRRLIAVLAKLDTSEWELLEKMALKLAEECKKEDQAEA